MPTNSMRSSANALRASLVLIVALALYQGRQTGVTPGEFAGFVTALLGLMSRTPAWIDRMMALRNRVVQLVGLKDLGRLTRIDLARADENYQPGQRVGIFTLVSQTPDEVLVVDRDKHLDVVVSVHCARPAGQPVRVTVTTVVHTKNRLGRLYMLPVRPMHKLIAPSVLRAIGA